MRVSNFWQLKPTKNVHIAPKCLIVVLENLPQLIIQIIYIIERKEIDDAVTFALISSFFSVIIVVFTYFFSKQIEFNQTCLRLKVEFATSNYKEDIEHFHRQKGYRRRLANHIARELGIMPEKLKFMQLLKLIKDALFTLLMQ